MPYRSKITHDMPAASFHVLAFHKTGKKDHLTEATSALYASGCTAPRLIPELDMLLVEAYVGIAATELGHNPETRRGADV